MSITWDQVMGWGNNIADALDNPLVNLGAQYYANSNSNNRNNTATNQAVGQITAGLDRANKTVRDYRKGTMRTARDVYRTAGRETQPYRLAGRDALAGYMDILKNPSQLADDPAYQWNFSQGAEAVTNNTAATGFRGSGNELTALVDYGQNQANNFRNDYLAGYLPMINTGADMTGQYLDAGQDYGRTVAATNYGASSQISDNEIARGNVLAGGTLGTARNDNTRDAEFMNILFGNGGSGGSTQNPSQGGSGPAGTANDIREGINTIETVGTELGNLSTAGNGSIGAGVAEAGRQTVGNLGGGPNVGSFGDMNPLHGARTTARMPTGNVVAGGAPVAGATAETFGLGADYLGPTSQFTPYGTNTVPSLAAPTPPPTGAPALGAGTVMQGVGLMGAMWAGLELLQNFGKFKGGSAESAKTGKLAAQLQRDLQSDPTGRAANQTLGRLLNGGLWGGEANGWVVSDLITSGTLPFNSRLLYTKASKYNPFADLDKSDTNSIGSTVNYMSYGLSAENAERFAQLKFKLPRAIEERKHRYDSRDQPPLLGAQTMPTAETIYTPEERRWMAAMESRMTPEARLKTAKRTREQILSVTPRADVTKLDQFIRSNS